MRNWILVPLFIVSSAFSSIACASLKDAIQIQIGGEPSTLDPARVLDQYGFGIMANVAEGLTRLDGDGNLKNGVADSYEISSDGLKYRFHLRKDAKWSDGKQVTADDFVSGFRRLFDPKTASPNAESLFAIKGSKKAFFGKIPTEQVSVAKDGDDLVIELDQPHPTLLYDLTFPCATPLRKDVFDANHGIWSFRFPTTGPYSIATYRPSDQIELIPNPFYPGSELRKPVRYRVLTEEITAMNLFEAGRLDVISNVTLTELDRLSKKSLVQVFPGTTVFYFSFNVSKPPFNDVQWRRALASSVDREGIARVLNRAFEPTTSYLPKIIDGYLPYKPLEDKDAIAKVRAMKDKPRLRLEFGSSAFSKLVTEKFQYDVEKKLGLKLELQPMELKTLLAHLKADPPPMYLLGMSALYNDPLNQLGGFANMTDVNFSRYMNSDYEKLVEQIRVTPDGEKKTSLAREANALLTEKDTIVVPVVVRNLSFGVSKSLKGFKVSPYQVIQIGELRK